MFRNRIISRPNFAMARVFKRKDRLSAMSEINITSLLDLVFCLLIIFMITTPLMEQTIPVNLPSQNAQSFGRSRPEVEIRRGDHQQRWFSTLLKKPR